MLKEWLYFGAHERPGHFLFIEGMTRAPFRKELSLLTNFDGLLPSHTAPEPYVATVSRLEGFGVSALAFWDFSVDSRDCSNSIVFAPSLTIAPAELLAEAQRRFPEVFNRLPRPVQLL